MTSADDGPHPSYTEQLLDGLKERGVHATFFVTGEHAEGHLIGNYGADEASVQNDLPQGKGVACRIAVYHALFLLCLLAAAHILPWQAVFFAVIITVFISDRQVFAKVDYSLLLTFTGFFVLSGMWGEFLHSGISCRI